jgi:hypothetical protein
MAITNAQLASTTTTKIFLSSGQNAITSMFFCNVTTGTSATFDLYIVPYTTSSNASVQTQVLKAVSLPPAETFVFDTERLILEDKDSIYAQASAGNVVTSTISYIATA